MKRLGLYFSIVLISAMSLLPLYSLYESLSLGKIPDPVSRQHWHTNNTTRLWGNDLYALQEQVVNIMFPAAGDSPQLVIITGSSSWQEAASFACLLAPPLRSVLMMGGEDNREDIFRQLEVLKPTGVEEFEGAQVILAGSALSWASEIQEQGYKVLAIEVDDYTVVAAIADRLRTLVAGASSEIILVEGDGDNRLALPALSWAASQGTPILFTRNNRLPQATAAAMESRSGANVYFLAAEDAIGLSLQEEIAAVASMQVIGRKDPVENAVAFARFYDQETDFGWNFTGETVEGGRNFLLIPEDKWQYAVLGAQLFSRGQFGPLLVNSNSVRLAPALEKFYFDTSPDWWATPAEGPYNRTWVIGNTSDISYPVQGRVDFLQETTNYETQGNQGVSGLESLALVWFVFALTGGIWIWFHLSTRMFKLSPVMKLSWILVVLSLGPVGIWAYYTCYRGYDHQVAVGEYPRPRWVQVLSATCSTIGYGIPVMVTTAFILTYLGLPLFLLRGSGFFWGIPMLQSIIWSYLAALAANMFLFVPLMLFARENSSYRDTVKDNWLTVIISMTSISIGMMTTMWVLMMYYLDMMPDEANILWWGVMYTANLIGLVTGYLGNWILVTRGEKKGTM